MQKWEYLYLYAEVDDFGAMVHDLSGNYLLQHVHKKPAEYQAFLNNLGSEGWELVACLQGNIANQQKIYFKRPIE